MGAESRWPREVAVCGAGLPGQIVERSFVKHSQVALVPILLVFHPACTASNLLGDSGRGAAGVPLAPARDPADKAKKVVRPDAQAIVREANGLPALIDSKATADLAAPHARAILHEIFGDALYNRELADVLFYYDENGEPKAPVLIQYDGARRVLDREAAIWAVVVSHWSPSEGCQHAGVRLSSIGEARPELALSVEGLVTTALSGKDRGKTPVDPKEESVELKPLLALQLPDPPGDMECEAPLNLCVGIQRFSLQADSLNRLSVRYPTDGKDETTNVKVTNDSLSVEIAGLAKGGKDDGGDPHKPKKNAAQAKQAAGQGGNAPGGRAGPPSDAERKAEEKEKIEKAREAALVEKAEKARKARDEKPIPTATAMNFANSRIPQYTASLAVGTKVYAAADWCSKKGGCRPTLYAFGHVRLLQVGGDETWEPRPTSVWSLVGGLRVLDPVLGDAVVGLRWGFGEGFCVKQLARFGVVFGVSYTFRTPDDDEPSATTKSDTTSMTTATTTMPEPGKTVTMSTTMSTTTTTAPAMNTMATEGSDSPWGAFLGVDFAF
jgi:hypothetical protein